MHLAGGGALAYERLVAAPGIRFLWDKPQGYDSSAAQLMPHAWQAGQQTSLLAARLRAVPDGGVIAISVPAGPMRCPPGPFERASLFAGYSKQHRSRCKVLIFDSNNRFPKQDAFLDAWRAMYPGMIEWIPVTEDGAVVRVDPGANTLYTGSGAHKVDAANIIPPQAPALLAMQTGLASDHGWCPVEPHTFESTLIAKVHVIGDACIADPMPKAASAAHAQARQCARAIIALLQGREAPPAQFESVCYSLLGQGAALSIHGRFETGQAEFRQMPAPEGSAPADYAQEARNADAWYTSMLVDCFNA